VTRAAWTRREAPRLRRALLRALGETLPRVPLAARTSGREPLDGLILERVSFRSGRGLRVPALFLRPATAGPHPAILYCHSHSHDYARGKEEILEGKGRIRPIGPILARAGYAVLAIDAWCFGERRADENTVAKGFLLQGRTLWGMMLADERAAIDYLTARREVAPGRIGCFGFSMGSTKCWWLAALDPRVAVAVSACGVTSHRALLAADALHRHGIYFYVPGILRVADADRIVSLIAPRPFLTLNGSEDAAFPLSGLDRVHREAGRVYRLLGARGNLARRVHPAGHELTDAMLRDTLGWFDRHLAARRLTAR
jgi:dienelactone hydrolase